MIFDLGGFVWKLGASAEFISTQVLPLLYFVVLVVPGAVRRMDWRHALVMLVLGGTCYALTRFIHELPFISFPYYLVVWPAGLMLIVACAECLLVEPRVARRFAWAVVLSLGAGCMISLVESYLRYTGKSSMVPGIRGFSEERLWSDLLFWPLRVVLGWIVVSLCLKLSTRKTRWSGVLAGAVVFASITLFLLFFNVFMFPLAMSSLRGQGPFTRAYGAVIVNMHATSADRQAMWEALEKSDWSKPWNGSESDYREVCITALAAHDQPATARRLLAMLQGHPSASLAELSAKTLTDQKSFDAVPILLRYALINVDNSKCTAAVEAMNVPEAALVILREASFYDRPAPLTPDFPIRPNHRDRLIRLLGADAGPNFRDWAALYDTAHSIPTAVPPMVNQETKRVVNAVDSYWSADGLLNDSQLRLSIKRLEDDGMGSYVQAMERAAPLLAGAHFPTDAELAAVGIDPAAAAVSKSYRDHAIHDMAVMPPNWDAPNTPALEREVEEYRLRVEAVIRKYFPVASSGPASRSERAE
jgi:hypothetical protein